MGRQFAIALGDYDAETGLYNRKQTRIVLERCEMPTMEGVEPIAMPYKSQRLKNMDSKLSLLNQTSVLIADESALKRLLRWYAGEKS